MWYWIIFLIAIFAGLAMTVREGIWSNTLTLINIILSGLVAFGFYSAIVVYLDEDWTSGQHTYWLDFAIIWALFCSSMIIFRSLSGACSKTRLCFKYPLDPVLGPAIGLLSAWVLASFALATLHVSPMPKDAFSGMLVYDDVEASSSMTHPDLAWLRFYQSMSDPGAFGENEDRRFRATSFVKIYADRRDKFNKASTFIVKRGGT